jgi:hypothetical protein
MLTGCAQENKPASLLDMALSCRQARKDVRPVGSAERGPSFHERAELFERITAPVGALHFITNKMS